MIRHITPKRGLADYSKYRLIGSGRRIRGVRAEEFTLVRKVDEELDAYLAQVGRDKFNARCAAIDSTLVKLARDRHRRPTDAQVVRAVVRRHGKGAGGALCVLAASVRLLFESKVEAQRVSA